MSDNINEEEGTEEATPTTVKSSLSRLHPDYFTLYETAKRKVITI